MVWIRLTLTKAGNKGMEEGGNTLICGVHCRAVYGKDDDDDDAEISSVMSSRSSRLRE